jgi:DNA-binding NtrC family response regulator
MRIMLVEDDNDAALALMAALASPIDSCKYELIHVGNLEKAVAEIDRGDIGAAIVDLGLPDSGGLQAPQVLCNAAPELAVVVWTGHNSDEAALELLKRGVQDYLVKGDVSLRRVRRAVAFAIARKRTEVRSRLEALQSY